LVELLVAHGATEQTGRDRRDEQPVCDALVVTGPFGVYLVDVDGVELARETNELDSVILGDGS
jgi:hypothetical protein